MVLIVTTLDYSEIKNSVFSTCKYFDAVELYNTLMETYDVQIEDKESLNFLINREIELKLKANIRNNKNGCLVYRISKKYNPLVLDNICSYVSAKCEKVKSFKIYDTQSKLKRIPKKTKANFIVVEH